MYHTQVLTNWQAEHVVVCRQRKPELPSVVSNDLCGGERGSGVRGQGSQLCHRPPTHPGLSSTQQTQTVTKFSTDQFILHFCLSSDGSTRHGSALIRRWAG